jgi:hypothetical protein
MRRRRRRDYTPAQEAARTQLERAELWVQIVSNGIGKALDNARYCHDGMRAVINEVNTSLVAAVDALALAQTAHDLAFNRLGRAASTVIVSGRPGRNPPRTSKKKAAPTARPKNKKEPR